MASTNGSSFFSFSVGAGFAGSNCSPQQYWEAPLLSSFFLLTDSCPLLMVMALQSVLASVRFDHLKQLNEPGTVTLVILELFHLSGSFGGQSYMLHSATSFLNFDTICGRVRTYFHS